MKSSSIPPPPTAWETGVVLCGVVVGVTPPSRARRRRRIYKTLKTFQTPYFYWNNFLSLSANLVSPRTVLTPGLTRHFILMNQILVSNKMLHFKDKKSWSIFNRSPSSPRLHWDNETEPFINDFANQRRLTLNVPCISESCIEIEIK